MFTRYAAAPIALSLCLVSTVQATTLDVAWPRGATIVAEAMAGTRLDLYVALPAAFVRRDPSAAAHFDEAWVQALSVDLVESYGAKHPALRSVMVWAVDPDDLNAGWQPLPALL